MHATSEGFWFAREEVAYSVSTYHRFALSTADVENFRTERGATISRKSIRPWVIWFGPQVRGLYPVLSSPASCHMVHGQVRRFDQRSETLAVAGH
ncbi:hypothetical protein AVO44_05510 [Ruegeria profundi]|uniref:Uncharacterized protein n=1 Tax=Ruegeria profundi TaxID=1685378 RepID=A0A0X3U0C3_9RHOB|nr:hypothetical protein AVO44_05510 [Ruegeria profundi]